MNEVNGLLAGIGAVLAGFAGVAALLGVLHHSRDHPQEGEKNKPSGDPQATTTLARDDSPMRRAAYAAAALAIAAFMVALVVIYQGLTPNTPLLQVPRFAAEFCGLLAVVAGSVVVLPLHKYGKNTAEIGGLALLTGFAVLTGMFVVARRARGLGVPVTTASGDRD